MTPRRVMIIGGSGSGKSTLARALGAIWNLPVYHIDREVHWLPGWVERPKAEKAPIVQKIVAGDTWIFEGNHSSTFPDRLARADMLIWTDAPLWKRLWRVTWRAIRGRGQTRPDLADECPEQLSGLPEFWRYLWVNRRTIDRKLAEAYAAAPIQKHHLRSFAQINQFVLEAKS